ncbi:MAG TPA: class I SAM-dependent methyltransferase, partial [Variovorax sp.]
MQQSQAVGAATPSSAPAHSEEWFGAYRDYWWNSDFLDLMARRWQLAQYQSLLDVGCGQCHWSRLLASRMAGATHVTALDRDARWAAGDAAIETAFASFGATVEFLHGDAASLP